MPLTLTQSVFDTLAATAQQAAPLEACGLLAGTDGQVSKCYVLTNADASAEHYRMLPEEQFAAINDMRRQGLRMLAIWHSHPASPARMSEEDLRLAFTPGILYVIISLAAPGTPIVRAFAVPEGVALETPVIVESSRKTEVSGQRSEIRNQETPF